VPLMPGCVLCQKGSLQLYRDSQRLPLAVTKAMEAKSESVPNFRVSGVGFSPPCFPCNPINPLLNLC
jgi:hypothetical protein